MERQSIPKGYSRSLHRGSYLHKEQVHLGERLLLLYGQLGEGCVEVLSTCRECLLDHGCVDCRIPLILLDSAPDNVTLGMP